MQCMECLLKVLSVPNDNLRVGVVSAPRSAPARLLAILYLGYHLCCSFCYRRLDLTGGLTPRVVISTLVKSDLQQEIIALYKMRIFCQFLGTHFKRTGYQEGSRYRIFNSFPLVSLLEYFQYQEPSVYSCKDMYTFYCIKNGTTPKPVIKCISH